MIIYELKCFDSSIFKWCARYEGQTQGEFGLEDSRCIPEEFQGPGEGPTDLPGRRSQVL